jgi:hypothetical protein
MLQVFHVNVVKVNRNVTYVAMAIHICCKCLFQMFQQFQMDVVHVLSGCCIYFTVMLQVFHPDVAYVFMHMLQVFHLDVAYVLQWLHTCFRCMLQVFQWFRAYVANVSSKCCKNRSGVAHVAVEPICSCYLLL